jgi:glyoxylase-like metal-dependent hydrolase (beta-lactamase superfamily II)
MTRFHTKDIKITMTKTGQAPAMTRPANTTKFHDEGDYGDPSMRRHVLPAHRLSSVVQVIVLALGSLGPLPVFGENAAGSMDVKWNEGASDCKANPQPPLQVHPYNEHTFILRESLCATYEGPFLYLLVGSQRALLIDTGAVSDAREMPLAQTVRGLLPRSDFPLLVVHTHGHLDHRSGDAQFAGDAHTQVIGTALEDVQSHFQFSHWPNEAAQVDLGERVVDVLPTPGHYPSELSYYDRQTGLFFSGDFLLPGRLLIADKSADLASARRAAGFAGGHPISYVLGGHVELDRAGNTFLGDHYHPDERPLQLTQEQLLQLPSIVESFNGFYGRHGEYVMENQNRVLAAAAAVLLALLAAAVIGIRALLRRRARRRHGLA